jgi:anti-sigma B factor antagonist
MELETEVVGDVGVLRLFGDVDAVETPKLNDAIGEMVGAGSRSLVIDIRAVDFIASDGLRALIRAHQLVDAHGGTVTIRHPSAFAHRLLQIACVDTLFVIEGAPARSNNPLRSTG